MYPFERIQHTKGVTPAQRLNGPPPVEVVKYVTFCDKNPCFGMFINLAFPPPRGGFQQGNFSTGWRKQ